MRPFEMRYETLAQSRKARKQHRQAPVIVGMLTVSVSGTKR